MRIPASSIGAITIQISAAGEVKDLFNVCVWYDSDTKLWRHNMSDYCHDGGFGEFSNDSTSLVRDLAQDLIDRDFFNMSDEYESPIIVESICNYNIRGGSIGETNEKYEVFYNEEENTYEIKEIVKKDPTYLNIEGTNILIEVEE
jgi:hypothetical protein